MNGVLNIQADAEHIPLKDDAVDLVFTSPPYGPQRTYGINAQRGVVAWVDWMLLVVAEMTRVSRGLVLVNCAGWTQKWCYQPGPEMLLSEWFKRGGRCWRPAYSHCSRIPGSGGRQWLRADIEYVLCFTKCVAAIPWADNVANGHTPKWGPGGEFSNRLSSGKRVNQWGPVGSGKGMGKRFTHGAEGGPQAARPSHVIVPAGKSRAGAVWGGGGTSFGRKPNGEHIALAGGINPFGNQQSSVGRRQNGDRKAPYFNGAWSKPHTKSLADGTDETQIYIPPTRANPGNVVKVNVGGGLLGHPMAHENEAPFPVDLAAWFIRSHCPPNGIVLDCFGGSGTTADAALREGRRAITADLRFKMCQLTARRLATPYAKKAKRPRAAKPEPSLFPEVA